MIPTRSESYTMIAEFLIILDFSTPIPPLGFFKLADPKKVKNRYELD